MTAQPQPYDDRGPLQRVARRAAAALEGAEAADIVRWAVETFGGRVAVTTSLQDAVLLDVVASVAPEVDVVFLDTGYHFPETIGMRDAVRASYPMPFLTIEPKQTVAEQDAEFGPRLYARDPDRCCAMRKVQPLSEALSAYDAWISGIRRAESATRRHARAVEWDERRGMVKVNPLVAWTDDDVDAYVAEHGVVVNPLQYDGYPSIGCAPCTRRVAAGDDPRSGRWAGTGKTECGLHQ